uniref:Uncharacterized protein n=1 Tax=Nelumbo nucifera TaxID=4432 RepID=A0A822YDJ0_NELNU|nr:TPA_asm: hypothetical protein HUJ06_009491 [Nelumbo nucifera]
MRSGQITESETHLLEINLISAQGLKPPLLTSDACGLTLLPGLTPPPSSTPMWTFIFCVSSAFLSIDTFVVCIDTYAVGYLKDTLIGIIHFLIANCLSSNVPSFFALQICRPSFVRFHGVLNISAIVIKYRTNFTALNGFSAIRYCVLMGKNRPHQSDHQSKQPSKTNNLVSIHMEIIPGSIRMIRSPLLFHGTSLFHHHRYNSNEGAGGGEGNRPH